MAKPPKTPPSSDIDGVHQDGTRPGKSLPLHGDDNEDVAKAARLDAGRPDYSHERSTDDRTS